MSISAWLLLIAVPLAKQILVGLGVGYVTYVGASSILDFAVSSITSNFSGVTSDMMQFIQMSGFIEAFAIILGGVSARLLLMSMTRFKFTAGAPI